MRLIESESAFRRLVLRGDYAIVFIDFDWSCQARLSAALVEEWERTSHVWGLTVPVFRLRPDDIPAAVLWMKDQGARLAGEGGYGSLIWLRSGVVVDYEPSIVAAGLRDLSRRTRLMLGKAKHQDSPLPTMWDRDLDG